MYRELADAVASQLAGIDAVPFTFTSASGDRVAERFRHIFPGQRVLQNPLVREAIKRIAAHKVPLFLRALRQEIGADDYQVMNLDALRYNLRVRIYEDRRGYSLQPHKDSWDTLFSFILHLDPANPRTNTYRRSGQAQLSVPASVSDKDARTLVRKFIELQSPGAFVQWGESQFHGNPYAWTDTAKCFSYHRVDDALFVTQFDESVLDGQFGDLFAIHNVKKGHFQFDSYTQSNDGAFHGVRPTSQESRRLLILDLIAKPTQDGKHLNLAGVGDSEDTFYVIYKEETCHALNQLLK